MNGGRVLSLWLLLALAGIRGGAQNAAGNPDRDTPAHQAARQFLRGVNVGNYLEYAPKHPAATQTYARQDFVLIRAEGFDHVRVPVAWSIYCGPGPGFTISNSIFANADLMVNSALEQGLNVILDLHFFAEFMGDPQGQRDKFYAIWRQVAAHYSNAPANVAFELLNEPNGAATTAVMNQIYPEAIRQIRFTNPSRTLLLGPGQWNGLDELRIGTGLTLPGNDSNLIATVHCYDPYYFTHQGAEWALPDTATVGVVYPGPPVVPLAPDPSITHSWVLNWFRLYNTQPTALNSSSSWAFRAKFQRAKAWADYYSRPVYVGEYGCYTKADVVSRLAFHREIREVMDQQGFGWALWDWKAGFHYSQNGQPDPPEMREALFPPPRLSILPNRAIECDAAIGKTFVVEKAMTLLPPITWQAVSTQVLSSPRFHFEDPAANSGPAASYRVKWIK